MTKIKKSTISRRILLYGVATAITGGIVYLLREPLIDASDRLFHPNLIQERQKVLDQLVREDPSPYVKNVVYDHNQSLIFDAPKKYVDDLINDPKYKQAFVEMAWQHFQNKGIENMTKEVIEDALTHPKIRKRLEELIINPTQQNFKVQLKKIHYTSITVNYPAFFGRGVKSDIYFFRDAFNEEKLEVMRRIFFIPSTEKLKVIYKHECFHTKVISEGIDLGNGLIINTSNYEVINPVVKEFIMETIAYIGTYEFFKKSQNHVALLYSAGKLAGFMSTAYEELKNDFQADRFTLLEKKLIRHQIEKYNQLAPEMHRLFQEYRRGN